MLKAWEGFWGPIDGQDRVLLVLALGVVLVVVACGWGLVVSGDLCPDCAETFEECP